MNKYCIWLIFYFTVPSILEKNRTRVGSFMLYNKLQMNRSFDQRQLNLQFMFALQCVLLRLNDVLHVILLFFFSFRTKQKRLTCSSYDLRIWTLWLDGVCSLNPSCDCVCLLLLNDMVKAMWWISTDKQDIFCSWLRNMIFVHDTAMQILHLSPQVPLGTSSTI